ncbi:MAG: hypothetical protein LBB91_04655 [Clostridiales bacterium]|nr:hypothetical protein [Clostridiales bacterium]
MAKTFLKNRSKKSASKGETSEGVIYFPHLFREFGIAHLIKKSIGDEKTMQNRTVEIKFRLNHKEADSLNKRVEKSGLSREGYLRQILSGYLPTDAPPPDYFACKCQALFYRVR